MARLEQHILARAKNVNFGSGIREISLISVGQDKLLAKKGGTDLNIRHIMVYRTRVE